MDIHSADKGSSAGERGTVLARPAADLGLLAVEELPSGVIVSARSVLSQLEDHVISLRHDADRRARKKEIVGTRPFYRCMECETPLLIRSDKRDFGHAYYFKHPHNSPECSLKRDDETLSRDEINAARYKGLPEGTRHIRLKTLVLSSVAADPSLKEIEKEHRIKHREDPKRYRTPDVSFLSEGTRVAVEAQVSNTSLDIMLDRQDFYAQHDALLLWVVDVEPEGDIRMYLKDVRAVHRGNIFVVDERSRDASFRHQQFMLWCYFFVPMASKVGTIDEAASKQLVSFAELHRNPAHAEMWFYDRPAALQRAEVDAADLVRQRAVAAAAKDARIADAAFSPKPMLPPPATVVDPFIAFRQEYSQGLARGQYEARHHLVDFMLDTFAHQEDWYQLQDRLSYIQRQMKTVGVSIPAYADRSYFPFARRMAILLSARFGRPIDFRHGTLVALAHHVVAKYPDVFWCFRHICRQYGAVEVIRHEDTNGNWALKERGVEEAWRADRAAGVRPRYAPDPYWRELAASLFPEVDVFRPARTKLEP